MSLPSSVICEPSPDCCATPAVRFYGQGKTYLSAQTGLIIDCPQGFVCSPGFYPHIITIEEGRIPFIPSIGMNPLRLVCCDGSEEVRYLRDGFTQAEFDAAAQSIADAAAVKLAGCIAADYNAANARRPTCRITTPSPLPEATVGDAYSVQLTAASTTGSFSFAITSGTLPDGLSFTSAGLISGTPTVPVTALLVIQVTDSAGCTSKKVFQFTVNDMDAPCSLFVADNTSFGVKIVPVIDGESVTWTGLSYGSFEFRYQGNAIPVAFVGVCDEQYLITAFGGQPTYLTTEGDSGNFPNQASEVFNCFAGSAIGFATEGEAIADYLTRTQPDFTHLENTPHPMDVTVTNHFTYVSGNGPAFDLVRTQKLIADQPLAVEIDGLATFLNGRFIATYNFTSTVALAFTANAVVVQAALNLLPPIIANGGVVCAGTLEGGMTITWNVNGARSLITAAISTISPGIIANVVRTQAGTGIQPEIQTLTVDKFCVDFPDSADPEYDGSIPNRRLFTPLWYVSLLLPGASTESLNRFAYVNSYITLECCPDAPTAAPSGTDLGIGTGDIAAGTYFYRVAFVNSNVEFTGSEGPLGPVSGPVVVAAGTSSIQITNVPLGPAGTVTRFLYRTRADNPNRFYGAVAIGDNVTTVAVDTVADADIFSAPIPAAHFWQLWLYAIANTPGPTASLMWAGFKTTGDTPLGGPYTAYRRATAIGCGTPEAVDGGIAAMDVSEV